MIRRESPNTNLADQSGDSASSIAETASASAPTLRQFALDFFTFFGSIVTREEDRPGVVRVDLAESLTEHFGASVLYVCFEHADVAHGCKLMARGSRLYDLMMSYLDQRSAATLLELPRRDTSSEQLMKAVRPRNASILNLRMRETIRRQYAFNWHLTYRSDEKYEEIYTVVVDEDGVRVPTQGDPDARTDAPALDVLFADAEAGLDKEQTGELNDGAKLPPMSQLVRMAQSARKYAVYHADTQSAVHEAAILPRLYRTVNRITTYYGQQIEEVYDSHDRNGEKRLALQDDMERKIAEEVDIHRLRVAVDLFSYAVFQMPVAVAEMTLSDGVREADIRVIHNRYSGLTERPRCHACGQETTDVSLDKYGHITCDECIQQCATCQEIVCRACGVQPCPVCGKQSCDECGEMCWACGERACPEHIDTCPVCGDRVCHSCMAECSHCGVRQCRSHLVSDAVVNEDGVYEFVCEACAVRCPGCQQYSAHVEVCQASGQRFCENCLVTCSDCGGRVGPGFYQISAVDGSVHCVRCMRSCPGCGLLTPDMIRCERCGAEYCPSCALTCDICGNHCCDGTYARFSHCDHVVCADHSTECAAGGELVCPICSLSCGVCEQPYCDEHSRCCRHCEQVYCANCVGDSGLCETCERLIAGGGETVDIFQEPCIADIEVVAMARHYRWRRAGNARYLIYEGHNRITGGVLVVIDAAQGSDNVVAVRRIGMLEFFRGRSAK